MRLRPSLLASLLVTIGLVVPRASVRAEDQLDLSPDRVDRLCKRYEGKPGLVVQGEARRLTCGWIGAMAKDRPDMMAAYRHVLLSSRTLSGLRKLAARGGLPADLDCGRFAARKEGAEQVLECHTDVGVDLAVLFRAGLDGQLASVECTTPHRRVYRAAYERAIARGDLDQFADEWVDLQADLLVETLQQAAALGDTVTPRPEEVFFRVVRASP